MNNSGKIGAVPRGDMLHVAQTDVKSSFAPNPPKLGPALSFTQNSASFLSLSSNHLANFHIDDQLSQTRAECEQSKKPAETPLNMTWPADPSTIGSQTGLRYK